MEDLVEAIAFLVALGLQYRLMWGINRKRFGREKCEFLALTYSAVILGVLTAFLRYGLGLEGASRVSDIGYPAAFANWLIYISVGLAGMARKKGFDPYTVYSLLIVAGVGVLAWVMIG